MSLREPERLHGTKRRGWRKRLAMDFGTTTPEGSPVEKKGSAKRAFARAVRGVMSFKVII
jgi:hypothetical protein